MKPWEAAALGDLPYQPPRVTGASDEPIATGDTTDQQPTEPDVSNKNDSLESSSAAVTSLPATSLDEKSSHHPLEC